jgi:hypothetical protein
MEADGESEEDTGMKATTMPRCIQEARELIHLAEEVPIKDFGMSFKTDQGARRLPPKPISLYGINHILMSMKLVTLKCKRCGWEWHPRTNALPKTCPNRKCKSPYWNKERRIKNVD